MNSLKYLLLSSVFIIMSCSDDSSTLSEGKEAKSTNVMQRVGNSIKEGDVTYKNINYHINSDGSFTRYIDNQFSYTLFLNDNSKIEIETFGDENSDIKEGYIIKNNYGDNVKISNIRKSNVKGKYLLDFTASNDINPLPIKGDITDIEVSEELISTLACPPCVALIVTIIGGIISDSLNDDFNTACRKSLEAGAKACVQAGGKASFTIENGWFSDTCKLDCR